MNSMRPFVFWLVVLAAFVGIIVLLHEVLLPFVARIVLAKYGPEAQPIRKQMREAIGPLVQRIWQDESASKAAPFAANAAAEQIYLEIQAMSPSDNLQRALQARAAQLRTDATQLRLLLFVEGNNSIPAPFLGVLVFCLIIFTSFSLFSDMNATVFISLGTFALSASAAIYLILELNDPFTGLMSISSRLLLNALGPLSP